MELNDNRSLQPTLRDDNEFIEVVDSFYIVGLTIKNEENSSQEICRVFSFFIIYLLGKQ